MGMALELAVVWGVPPPCAQAEVRLLLQLSGMVSCRAHHTVQVTALKRGEKRRIAVKPHMAGHKPVPGGELS